jgi:peptidoglycan/xylan/chitin deacetylase (PgdA/CDA1 family)
MRAQLRFFYRFARCALRPRVVVLMYHCISPPGRTEPHLTVSPERFEEQMAFLGRSGLAVSMDEFLGYLRGGLMPRGGRVLVTLDDAEVDILSYAAPILRRHGVPATVFVPTGAVGRPDGFWWHRLHFLARAAAGRGDDLYGWLMQARPELACPDPVRDLWKRLRLLPEGEREELLARAADAAGNPALPPVPRPMSWDELAELGRDGLITLGAHTVTHAMMAALTDEQLGWELRTSREQLARLPAYRDVFAYPYGDPAVVTDCTRSAVQAAGFAAGFTTRPASVSPADDPWTLGRVAVDDVGVTEFRWAVDHGLCLDGRRGRG